MTRIAPLAIVVAAFVLGACGSSTRSAAKDPSTLLAHLDRMIAILEDHRADPDRATRELTAYEEKHRAELERLRQALAEVMQRDPMKAAAVSAAYGLKSAQLEAMAAEAAAKARARDGATR
ncbi:MAG TPA: hypothetical protein VEB43_05295 [Anaeromyxobacter sp.]|nr:hypothetical protein [Anaeromyxobacter sp.]